MTLDLLSLSLLPKASSGAGSVTSFTLPQARTNPVPALDAAVRGRDKGVAAQAQDPQVKREVAAFRAAVATAKDPAALLANPEARRVLLTANGLEDQVQYAALASKALLPEPTAGSLAARLTDTRWKAAAQSLEFANQGLTQLRTKAVQDRLADAYAEVRWRQGLDKTTPGLSNAIEFRTRAAGVTNADQVLGDKVLREVVTVALGIPKQIAFQQLPAQELAITSKLDLSRLQDPKFVEQFARRYLVAAGQASDTSTAAANPGVVGLFV